MPQLNWGTGLGAALYGVALGLLERQRQSKDDERKMKIDEEKQARHAMGQMLIKAASEGNVEALTSLSKSGSMGKLFDPQTMNALTTMATSTRQAMTQQQAALGFGPQPEPTPAPGQMPPMASAPTAAPSIAAGPPPNANFRPQGPPPSLETAGGGMTAEQPTPPSPALLVPGATRVSDVTTGAQKPPLVDTEPVVEPGPTPASTVAKPVGREVAHERQVNDLASFNYYKPGELKRTGEGVSVSIPLIGKGGTVTMRGPTEEEIGRRIFARAQSRNFSYAATIDAIVQRGAKIPDDLRAYGANLADREYAAQLKTMTGGGERTPTGGEARQAAQQAFLKTGYVSDTIKQLLVPTKDDETRLWAQVFQSAVDSGKGLAAATTLANATGAVPDIQAVKSIQETAKAEFQAAIENDPRTRDWSPEQKTKLLGSLTGFIAQTPEERQAVAKEAPLAPGTAAKRFEETGKVPRLSDFPSGQAPDIKGTRKRAEAEEATRAAEQARLTREATQTVPEKPTVTQQEQATNLEAARRLSVDIMKKYETVGQKIGGAFGAQGRLSSLKVKLNDEQQADVADLRADSEQLKAHLLHALSGAQVGYRDPYLAVLPNVDTNSNVEFKANVRATIRNIERLQQVSGEIQRRSGTTPAGRPPLVNPYK